MENYPNLKKLNTNHPRVGQQKVGRNDPCPCGSGKKYKKCHLAAYSTADQLKMIEGREKHRNDPRNQK